MNGCWPPCSTDTLPAPGNSIVCRDFASRCRPRLSVAQDMVSPPGGNVQIARFVDSFFIFITETDREPRWARRFASAAPSGPDAAHHLGWPIEVHRHPGPGFVGIVLRCGPRRLAGDNGSFSVAHRGPRASSVPKIPSLTAIVQSNGEMPGGDTPILPNAPVIHLENVSFGRAECGGNERRPDLHGSSLALLLGYA
jgi:hypothetical protein